MFHGSDFSLITVCCLVHMSVHLTKNFSNREEFSLKSMKTYTNLDCDCNNLIILHVFLVSYDLFFSREIWTSIGTYKRYFCVIYSLFIFLKKVYNLRHYTICRNRCSLIKNIVWWHLVNINLFLRTQRSWIKEFII